MISKPHNHTKTEIRAKRRESNFELLRIISMLMVICLHAGILHIGLPKGTLLDPDITGLSLRAVLQSFCILSVNTFVMISGWFRIKPSLKSFCNLIWQVAFFVTLIQCCEIFFSGGHYSIKSFLQNFGLFEGGGWFVTSYIGLYIVSPILNGYIDTEKQTSRAALLLILFFGFQFIFGDTGSAKFIVGGFSTFNFIGLYILAAFLRKHQNMFSIRLAQLILLTSIVIDTIIFVAAVRLNLVIVRDAVYNYINPFVIIGAASLVMIFAKIKIKSVRTSKLINYTAQSCFAVYLLHFGTDWAYQTYKNFINTIYNDSTSVPFLITFLVIMGICAVALILDQPRKLIWNNILRPLIANVSK